MKQRVFFLLATYAWTVFVFILAKMVFLLSCGAGHMLSYIDVWDVIRHGLTLDLSTSLYIIAIPFLLTFASVWAKGVIKAFPYYFAVISIALALAFVTDTSLYPFWGFKLDASCLQYIETPTEAMASVNAIYLIIRLLYLVVIFIVIYAGYHFIYRSTIISPIRKSQERIISLIEPIIYLAFIPVIIIGIRGGLDESTTNIGQVYYSQNQFLNHAAVNPVFSFLSSFEKTASNIVDYEFMSQEACNQQMEGLYPQAMSPADKLLFTKRPNIVIILMESAGEVIASAMPRLQQLKQEGINFSHCYANSWRTDRGTVCTYSGYPSFPTSSVMKMPHKTQALPGLATSLLAEGYKTAYIYGGDINFTNMRSYLIGTGFQRLIWKQDYRDEEQESAKWGVRDDITLDTLYELLTSQGPEDAPLFVGYSSLSSHEPWDVPIHQLDDPIANAFYYLDACLGNFIDRLKQTPQWENTLVIILPDHSIDYQLWQEYEPGVAELRNRIPLLWVGGCIREPLEINSICNQTDLAATLLGQLGIDHEAYIWSRDVLSSDYRQPFAVHNFNNGFAVIAPTGFIVYDLDAQKVAIDSCSDAAKLETMGKAILQQTTRHLKELQ